MDDEVYYNDRQVLTAIARSLKEISRTLKELAERGVLTETSQRGLALSQKCDINRTTSK